MICGSLENQACIAALNEMLWNFVGLVGSFVCCIISIEMEYVTGAVVCVGLTDDIFDEVHIVIICSSNKGGVCRVAGSAFFIVASDVEFEGVLSLRRSCTDCSSGESFLGHEVCAVQSIDIYMPSTMLL